MVWGGRGYPPEFRRKVLDLVEAGCKVADVARDLGISDSDDLYLAGARTPSIQWLEPGLEQPRRRLSLHAAKRRIAAAGGRAGRASAGDES